MCVCYIIENVKEQHQGEAESQCVYVLQLRAKQEMLVCVCLLRCVP